MRARVGQNTKQKRKENIVGEIIFDKSKQNLKKLQELANSQNVIKNYGRTYIFVVAGYMKTYELLKMLGFDELEIHGTSDFSYNNNFMKNSHGKRVVLLRRSSFVTVGSKSKKDRELNNILLNTFENWIQAYAIADGRVKMGQKYEGWERPRILVIDDINLDLQMNGYRLKLTNEVGVVQPKNPFANEKDIYKEIQFFESTDDLFYVPYQYGTDSDEDMIAALNKLKGKEFFKIGNELLFKPKTIRDEIGIEMRDALLNNEEINMKMDKKASRISSKLQPPKHAPAFWVRLDEKAYQYTGKQTKDFDEIALEKIKAEEDREKLAIERQEKSLEEIMQLNFPFNIQVGYAQNDMKHTDKMNLSIFVDDIDKLESEKIKALKSLTDATTDEEYQAVKKYRLAYFLDGSFKNNERKDDNYLGGKRLIAIDIDNHEYERSEIEDKLENQGLFGMIYPTAKYYFNGAKRWRLILVADKEMNKDTYRTTVDGVAKMLNLEIDEASKKISQLMGYPFQKEDVTTVAGTMVNVEQFKPLVLSPKVTSINKKNISKSKKTKKKSLLDWNNKSAQLLKQALESGIPEGNRDNGYRKIKLFLDDVMTNEEFEPWADEAEQLLPALHKRALQDGLEEKDVERTLR